MSAVRPGRPLGTLTRHPEAARRLRRALELHGFGASSIARAVQVRSTVLHDASKVDWRAVAGDDSPLTTLIELFVLGRQVTKTRAAEALSPLTLQDAVRAGFVELDGTQVASRWELVVQDGFVLIGDHPDLLAEGQIDFVAPTSRTARTLAYLADRSPVSDVLDLGTGSGIQALFAASHGDRVLATDVNPRALEIARMNADLNEAGNVDHVAGDWFAAVDSDRSFDRIVANLPFIPAPDVFFRFANAGKDPQELTRELIIGAIPRLRDQGLAQLLTAWTRSGGEDPFNPIHQMVSDTRCDCLVLRTGSTDATVYATQQCNWIAPSDPTRYGTLLQQWLEHFRGAGIETVEYGLITLRPTGSAAPWFASIDLARPLEEPCGDLVRRIFAGRDYLTRTPDDDALLAASYRLVDSHRLRQSSFHGADGYVQEATTIDLDPDPGFTLWMQPAVAAVVFSMSDAEPLGRTTGRLAAQLGTDERSLRALTSETLRLLVGSGFAVRRSERAL